MGRKRLCVWQVAGAVPGGILPPGPLAPGTVLIALWPRRRRGRHSSLRRVAKRSLLAPRRRGLLVFAATGPSGAARDRLQLSSKEMGY